MEGPQRNKSGTQQRKLVREPVIKPVSQLASATGVLGDNRPTGTNSNLQRAQWGIVDRQSKSDWKES